MIEKVSLGKNMRKKAIQTFIDAVEEVYGPICLYGSDEKEKYGTCFILTDIKASFSVIMNRQKADKGTFSIQIESCPPGDYVSLIETCSLDRFLELVEKFKKPIAEWPQGTLKS